MKPFVGVAAVLALIVFGCDAPLPTRQTDTEFSREMTEIHLIGPLNDCLKKHPLSFAGRNIPEGDRNFLEPVVSRFKGYVRLDLGGSLHHVYHFHRGVLMGRPQVFGPEIRFGAVT
jgi:hypothetical protein